MKEPYLTDAPPEGAPPVPVPPGHRSEVAGVWEGRQMVVVYDPRRHDVAFLRGKLSPRIKEGLENSCWELRRTEGLNQMWVRDRLVLARQRLRRTVGAQGPLRIA